MQGCLEGGWHQCKHAVHWAEQWLQPRPPEPLGEAPPVMHSCLPHTCIQRPKSPAAQTRLGFGNKAKSAVLYQSLSASALPRCARDGR